MISPKFHPSRKVILIVVNLLVFLFIFNTLYSRTSTGSPALPLGSVSGSRFHPSNDPFAVNLTAPDAPHEPKLEPEAILPYVRSILDPKSTEVDRFDCPEINTRRYSHLKATGAFFQKTKINYFFALDLRDEGIELLPRLVGSIVEAIRFLGPRHCALSIVIGSGELDGSFDVLNALVPELELIGAKYYLRHTALTSKEDRITTLAKLRNLALAPLTNPAPADEGRYTTDTVVAFLNDVALCAEDILELMHQRKVQGADMTCGMDWSHLPEPVFYDVWVARTLAGDSFFNIPKNSTWDFAKDLFWNPEDVNARRRYQARKPVQVYACWNGGAVFTAAPLFRRAARPGAGFDVDVADPRYKVDPVRFRSSMEKECFMGEPTLFCKDFWYRGFGKIAVVPTVNVEYTMEDGLDVKMKLGFTSTLVGADAGPELDERGEISEKIEWQLEPPAQVKCARSWATQSWLPWNESLEEPAPSVPGR